MPVYEYKCTECTDRFEIEQRITDDALTTLDGCAVAADGAHKLKKVFSSIGISFKGDGFYRNDARGGKSSSRTAGTTPESTGSSSTTGDSTPATTTATEKAAPATPAPSTSSSAD